MPDAALNAFSDLAQSQSAQIRNCANEPELRAWFERLLLEKFQDGGERAMKAGAWCSTVGRKHMLRVGASEPFSPSPEALAAGPAWIREAAATGKPLTAVSLEPSERELFSSILDWMRSDAGPALGSDWSKISVPQAKAAELAWIDAMAKEAAKRDLDAADAVGTMLFAALGPGGVWGHSPAGLASTPEWAEWRWVEVFSADALDREGSLMRHCVGYYAKAVAEGGTRIYSLRDPSNAPKLTIEARGEELIQLKAHANSACPAQLRPAVAAFAGAFKADVAARGLGEASATAELAVAGVGSLPGLGWVVGGLCPAQAETLRRWIAAAEGGAAEAGVQLGAVIAGLAGLGLAAELASALRCTAKPCDWNALTAAATHGHVECVELLIPFSSATRGGSLALTMAAYHGHEECVKRLIPVSAPKAADSRALRHAASHGRADIVGLLIPASDPKVRNSEALRVAAKKGHAECVELLLPCSDPLARNLDGSTAQDLALEAGHPAVAAMVVDFLELQTLRTPPSRLAEWRTDRSVHVPQAEIRAGGDQPPQPRAIGGRGDA